ncbi:hypothetical protein JCM24511_02111 [Saitozyma sp. JCM 24511]|nr:hypothetical protein JCM24511_02111 [Saitozyma sp. JCM 24511]
MSTSQVGEPLARASPMGTYGHPRQSHSLSDQPPPLHPPPHLPPHVGLNGVHAHHPSSYKQSNGSVHAGQPHAHALSALPAPCPSTYRAFPLRVAAGEMSPTTFKGGVAVKRGTAPNKGSQRPARDCESGSEDEDKKEKSKLENRREKNRVKQRKLRMRRANHIVELETSITSLRSEHTSLQSALSVSQQREAHLESRIRDLGSALFSDGLSGEADGTRRAWSVVSSSSTPTGALGCEGWGREPRTISGRDPLNTLAQAALPPEHTREGATLQPLVSQWNRPSSRHSESDEKKCKREALDPPLYAPTFGKSSSASDAGSYYDQAFESLHGLAHERVASRGYNRTREHSPRRITVEPTTTGASSAGSSERLVNASWRSSRVASALLPPLPQSSSSSSLFTPPEWVAPSPRSIRIEDLLSSMAPAAASLPSQAHTLKVGQEDEKENGNEYDVEREREQEREREAILDEAVLRRRGFGGRPGPRGRPRER